MFLHAITAFFYWNPSREILTIPYIERPLAWYGILFVTGFFLGFMIIVPLLSRKLAQSPLKPRDVASWHHLCKELIEWPLGTKCLGKQVQEELSTLRDMQDPNPSLKKGMISSLNACKMSRQELENAFPKGILTCRQQSINIADRLTWYIVAGTLIGARLGHVFFYGWTYFREHLIDIFKVWEGGLASHGGAIGVIIAVVLFHRSLKSTYPEFSLLNLMDILAVPTALAACFIRLGNFVNQEIVGTETTVPWAVIFGSPFGGHEVVPRHPAQLYEGVCYLAIFVLLFQLWKKQGNRLHPGALVGILFTLIFTSRFFIEFVKMPQSLVIDESFLQTGQLLSIPFIFLGLWLYFYSPRLSPAKTTS